MRVEDGGMQAEAALNRPFPPRKWNLYAPPRSPSAPEQPAATATFRVLSFNVLAGMDHEDACRWTCSDESWCVF